MCSNQISSLCQNRWVHLNRQGRQFSQVMAAEVCASALVMLDTPHSEVVWEYWLSTPFANFPFISPPMHHCVPSGFKCTILISVRGWVDLRATVWLEELYQRKLPMTPSWIEPMTFRQCLNQLGHYKYSPGVYKFSNNIRSTPQSSRCWWVDISKFHFEDPHFWSDLWISLLSGTFYFVHVNWHIFVWKGKTGNYAENIRHNCTQFSCPCKQAATIHAPPVIHCIKWYNR